MILGQRSFQVNDVGAFIYPLEQKLRKMGTVKGAFVAVLLDCSREPKYDILEGQEVSLPLDDHEEETGWNHVVMSFSCGAGGRVFKKSYAAKSYFSYLIRFARESEDNLVEFPGRFASSWGGKDGKCESQHQTFNDTLLKVNIDKPPQKND